MVVGIAKIDLIFLSAPTSLKEKRQVLRRIKDRVKNKFDVSIAEVGNQDLWQRGELGVAVVTTDSTASEQILNSVLNYIESEGTVEIVGRDIELQHY